uniref:DH domain-containing protein n=1 Tax=Vombatus ursinus TaxID=29139 RepID=A0A4X2JZY7_VOMUR
MQESLFEVVTSEASYLRSLQLLMDTFVLSASLRDTLTPRDHHTLFSNVHRVQGVSERFLGVLLSRVRRSPHISDLCDVVHAHAEGPFSVYVDYVRNQQYQEETYRRLMETNMRFSAELHRLQSLPQCQRLPLPSFLLLPFQRITRLRMLLQVLGPGPQAWHPLNQALPALGWESTLLRACSYRDSAEWEDFLQIRETPDVDSPIQELTDSFCSLTKLHSPQMRAPHLQSLQSMFPKVGLEISGFLIACSLEIHDSPD